MKKVKYITSAILLTITFLFIGELFAWNLTEFDMRFDYVTFYLPRNVTSDEMVQDLMVTAEKYDVEIFVTKRTFPNILTEEVQVYGTSGAEAYVKRNAQVRSGLHHSLLLGDTSITFSSFAEIEGISLFDTFRLIGTDKNQVLFKQALIDIYGGSFPRAGISARVHSFTMIGAWLVVYFLFLLMTLYDVTFLKKEAIVRMVSGERLRDFVFRHMFTDVVAYFCIFLLVGFIISRTSNVLYFSHITIIGFLLFICSNSLLYVNMLRTDFRKDIVAKYRSKRILYINYVYKVFVAIVILLALAGNIRLIADGVNFYRQRDFFTTHRDYYYAQAFSLDISLEEQDEMEWKFYEQFSEKGRVISLVNLYTREWFGFNFDVIYANRGAVPYLLENIQSLKEHELQDGVYFLVPARYEGNSLVREHIQEVWQSYYSGNITYEVIYYHETTHLMAIGNQGRISSRLKQNPIVILNHSQANYAYLRNMAYIGNSSLVRLSEAELNTFLEAFDLIGNKTNSYAYYIQHWEFLRRGMTAGIVLFALLVIMNIFVTRSTLQYEYNVHGKELAVKKVLGYKLLERHRRFFMAVISSNFFGLVGAIIFSFLWNIPKAFVFSGFFVIIFGELVLSILYVTKMEKISMQKILKGGFL